MSYLIISYVSDAVRLKQEVDMDASHDGPALQQSPAKGTSGVGSKRSATASADNSSSSGRSSPSPPPAKAACLDAQVFQCPMCSYRADKPASLNRHMRIHNRQSHAVGQQETTTAASARAGSAPGTGSGAGSGAGAGSVPSSATYCKECNIQFSSLGTYRCHKDHYCSQRQVGRGPSDAVKEDGPQFGLMAPASLHGVPADLSAASFQLTSLGQTGLLFPHSQAMAGEAGGLPSGGAMMPGGQAAVILTAPVMTPSGLTSMAIPLPTVLVQSIHNAAAAAAAHAAGVGAPVSPRAAASPRKSSSPKVSDSSPRSAPEEAHQSKSPKRIHAGDPEDSAKELPLDLSTKRTDAEGAGSADMRFKKETEEEERSPVSSSAPASHSSPAAGRSGSVDGSSDHHPGPGPSPALSAATSTSMPGLPPPALLKPSLLQGFLPMHPMAAAAGMAGLPVTPQGHAFAAVPPGVSKCTDCNIIFYKHENFLIHKQHYCSGKKLRPSATAPAISPRAAEPDVKPEAPATTTTTPEPGTTGRSPQKSPTLNKDHGSGSVGQTHHTSPSPGVVKVPVRGGPGVATATAATVGLEDVYYKFFCIPCKIKFSSASNLKAHKEYYCPHGKNSEHTVIVQTPSGEIVGTAGAEQRSPSSSNGSSSPSPGQYYCGQCRATFTSSRLLKLHLCSAEVAQASLLRCSHCDYVTHTDKRLAEHMKVHNPTSAYRCTLCGYRGNTVRGMRMHGKSHTDNGEDFTDSHMIEFQEPPLVPIQANNDHKGPHGPVDVEAELLRLKNEPYKRRRSRKAYEKVDILVPLDEPHSCQLCGECFADPRSLAMHLRIHEIASQYVQEHSRCSQCDYVTKSVEDLRAHMEISHALIAREEKENRPESTSPDRAASLERRSYERVSGLEKRSPVRIKDEPIDRDYDLRGTMPSGSVRDQCRRNGSAPEHSFRDGRSERDSVDYNSQAEERSGDGGSPGEDNPDVGSDACSDKAETVRVKIEPGLVVDRDEDSCNDPPLPITFATHPATSHPPPSSTPSSPASSDPKASAGQGQTSPPTTPPGPSPAGVKLEPDFPSHSLPTPNASLFPRFFVSPPSSSCAPPPLLEAAGASSSQEKSRAEERAGESSAAAAPYCKNCDISFTYLSTFVAHKKYYCTESAGVAPSATA